MIKGNSLKAFKANTCRKSITNIKIENMLSSVNNIQEREITTDRKATLPLLQTNSMPVFSRYDTNQSKISEKAR